MYRGRWYVVWLLAVLYVFSYADRLILALLVDPLKADLLLTDTQIALLIGPAFAILYAILGLPVAWLADRYPRKIIAIIGVCLWSFSTVASGFASNFEQLFLLRMGLALGEAVLSPVAVSLISDLFKREERSTPTAVFVTSGTVGLVTAYVVGGALIGALEAGVLSWMPVIGEMSVWRATLVLIGAPGFALAALLAFTTREPKRGQLDLAPPGVDLGELFGAFRSKADGIRFYVCFFLGNSICMMLTFAGVAWIPTYYGRGFGLSASESGYVFGIALVIGAVFGFVVPTLAQRLARVWRGDALIIFLLALIPTGFAFFAAALLQGGFMPSVVLLIIGFGMLSGTNAQSSIAVALTAPPSLRGRLMAVNLASSNIIGLSLGPFLAARISETWFDGPRALGGGMLVLGCIVIPMAWALIAASWKPYAAAMRGVVMKPADAEPEPAA